MVVHLVDGTYELFRHFFSPAAAFDRSAPEGLGAVRGVVASILGMLDGGVTHLGVATDHVIEGRGSPALRPVPAARGCAETLATLRADGPIVADVDALRWRGPRADFAAWSARLGTPQRPFTSP